MSPKSKTIDIMSSNLRGWATRVYEAYDVENPDSRVVIKDSWVNADRPKERDTLNKILDDASNDERAILHFSFMGVVEIDGREDLTKDLLNGYTVSTKSADDNSQASSSDKRVNFNDAIDEIKLAKISFADYSSVEDTAQGDLIYKASLFEVLRPSKPSSRPRTLVTSADVSTPRKAKQPLHVYDSKAHYGIVFKEREQSLHSMSRGHHVKVPLVVKGMILCGVVWIFLILFS